MPLTSKISLSLLLSGLSLNQWAWAGQLYQERLLDKQLTESVKEGQVITLPTEAGEFLAIYSRAKTPKSRGGVILLHNLGAHADWPDLISPLRTQLPNYGWETLSLQMPVPPDQLTPKDYADLLKDAHQRIASGIEYLNSLGLYNMIIVGHSLGGSLGLNYLASKEGKSSKVIAFVGMSIYDHSESGDSMTTTKAISETKIAILDIVGSLDRQVVLDSAELRKKQMKKSGRRNFRQITITGADHFFTALNKTLLKRIRAWLDKQAPSLEIDLRSLQANP